MNELPKPPTPGQALAQAFNQAAETMRRLPVALAQWQASRQSNEETS